MSTLRLDGVSAAPWGRLLLRDITLSLEPGEVLGLAGPNGAGKSSLLLLIAGDVRPSAGQVSFGGRPLSAWSALERARQLAFLPQMSLLNFPYTVEEVVMLGRTPHSSGHLADRDVVAQALHLTDTLPLQHRLYTELSVGEKQRTQLARVFAQVCGEESLAGRLLLLDEPTSALDLAHQQQLLLAVRQLARRGCGVVLVIHDLNLAASIVDRVLVLDEGRQVALGRPEQVFTRELFKGVFGVDVSIGKHPREGYPYHHSGARRIPMKLLPALLCISALTLPARALTVQDFAGREVTLQRPAGRIVALAPDIVENLFSAGAGDRLVGAVSYSNFPQQAGDIPVVGSYNAFSLEQILALHPDLVVMWGSGNGMQALSALEGLGIPVYVSELRKLSDVPDNIRRLGELAGTQRMSEPEARRPEREIESLRTRFAGRRPVSVFYQIWNEPLQTVNGEHLISEVIALCGGVNVFGDSSALAPRISVEAVLLRNPDAIVASGMGTARPEWLDQWRAYPSLKAVAGNALFFIEPDHLQRPTARILLGAGRLCEQLDQVRRHGQGSMPAGMD